MSRNTDPLLAAEGHRELLLGNEAIVRGALEAGVAFASGYPGTPSSEVTDSFARLAGGLGIAFEYSVNEKIALEVAFAASLAGARSITAMKHLGLTYAGDPLTTIPYIGTVAGLVIVSAGDPSCRTSPNEQDQRHLADMLHIPLLDPSDPQEALEMTRFAFELSERSRLPVILRPTTRVCHTRSMVTYGALVKPTVAGFQRDPRRFVPVPVAAQRMRREIDDRLQVARELVLESGFVRRTGAGTQGVLSSGAPAAMVADVLRDGGLTDQVVSLQLGAVHPLSEDWLIAAMDGLESLLVVEELSPYLEDAVRALCNLRGVSVKVYGKRTGHFPHAFEYGPELIRTALHGALGLGEPPVESPAVVSSVVAEPPPPRRPILCASCGHRSAFFAARAAFGDDTLYFNDIGCYTLGFDAPLQTGDALLCMGAGFTLAIGVSRMTGQRTVGFMGDSTFFHSGMPALLDAVKEKANVVAVILDNDVTAMTGFQESPTVQVEGGRLRRTADMEGIVRAFGVASVETVDPNDLAATISAFERARDQQGVAVVIARRPCAQYLHKLGKGQGTSTLPASFVIDHDRCQQCGRESLGHRCAQECSVPFERSMARARSLAADLPIDSHTEVAACAERCPLYLCIQGYASHIAAGQFGDALELIMSGLPLPSSVCRVCDRPCESGCVRGGVDAPVAINDLKRFVVDWADAQDEPVYRPSLEPAHGHSVAVVGAGPSGLAAAHELRLRGYDVTLLDADDQPGGLLRRGIPRYRLPVEVLDRDIKRVLDLGVQFEGGRRLGTDFQLAELLSRHDAVCLAVGAHRSVTLALPGTDCPEIVDALAYLRGDGRDRQAAGSVLVVGGGNAAIDAARTALRNGAAQVTIACLERREQMPAIEEEIGEALHEGVELLPRVQVVRGVSGGVELVDVAPRDPSSMHPENFAALPGTGRLLEVDLVIAAIGQRPDTEVGSDLTPALAWTAGGQLQVDSKSCQTAHPRVFACGDAASSYRTVTRAIAGGLRAAWGIDVAVRGESAASHRQPPPLPAEPVPRQAAANGDHHPARQRPVSLAAASRVANFDEVVGALDEQQARAEAARCMVCGRCGNCRSCLDTFGCPAFYLRDGRIEIDPALCVGCGVCAQLCTNDAIAPGEARR